MVDNCFQPIWLAACTIPPQISCCGGKKNFSVFFDFNCLNKHQEITRSRSQIGQFYYWLNKARFMYFPVAAFSGFSASQGISPSSGAGIMRVSVAIYSA